MHLNLSVSNLDNQNFRYYYLHNIRIQGQSREITDKCRTRNLLNCFENALVGGGLVRKHRLRGKEDKRGKFRKLDLSVK